MPLSEYHALHIRKVVVGFVISGKKLNPQEITEALQIQPDAFAEKGNQRLNKRGDVIGVESEGYWRVDTIGKVESKDINEHFRFLLSLLLPQRETILKFAQDGETYFDVLWQSTYLYSGTGPLIDKDCLQGIVDLQASIGFDIYQIDDVENSILSDL